MAVVGEIGEHWLLSDHEGDYSSGTTATSNHVIGATPLGLHAFLTRFQATTAGPPGAAIGVSDFTAEAAGPTVFGPDSSTWTPILYHPAGDKITEFTVSWEAVQADIHVSWFAQFFDA